MAILFNINIHQSSEKKGFLHFARLITVEWKWNSALGVHMFDPISANINPVGSNECLYHTWNWMGIPFHINIYQSGEKNRFPYLTRLITAEGKWNAAQGVYRFDPISAKINPVESNECLHHTWNWIGIPFHINIHQSGEKNRFPYPIRLITTEGKWNAAQGV